MLKSSGTILLGILLVVTILISGCGPGNDARQATNGNIVQVHYTGTLADGTVFDTSVDREPLEFTLGAGKMISGFEQAVPGMKVGELKTITIPAADAYGPRRDDMIIEVNREELPGGLDPNVGDQLPMTRTDGGTSMFPVIKVSEKTITIDANHPLAGKDLTFEIELIQIQ